jgi:CxxC-x17-CxxC domain-containing protein
LGTGSKGYYSILIDKFEPTFGPLKGQRLNAWKHGSKVIAAYDPLEASRPEADPDLARFSPASSPDVAPIPYVPYVPDYPNNPNNNTYDVDDEPEKLPDMGQETEKQAKTKTREIPARPDAALPEPNSPVTGTPQAQPAPPAARPGRTSIICASCSQPDTVSFPPTDGRPVYCRSCYVSHNFAQSSPRAYSTDPHHLTQTSPWVGCGDMHT